MDNCKGTRVAFDLRRPRAGLKRSALRRLRLRALGPVT